MITQKEHALNTPPCEDPRHACTRPGYAQARSGFPVTVLLPLE